MYSFHSNHQLQCDHLWDNQGVSVEIYMEFGTEKKYYESFVFFSGLLFDFKTLRLLTYMTKEGLRYIHRYRCTYTHLCMIFSALLL